MRPKAIIIDIDGTALDSPVQKLATRRLAIAIRNVENLGIRVCAATGRSQSFAVPALNSMGLDNPAIVAGGTRIIDPVSGDKLWECSLTEEQANLIVEKLKPFDYGYLWNDSTEQDYLGGGWPLNDYKYDGELYFFEVCFVPNAEADSVLLALSTVDGVALTKVVAQRPRTNDIHITNTEATKEHAIYELQKLIGASKDELIGVGDGHNDLHIFNAVGYKVAMGNAVSDLKERADLVIGSVKEDGLAKYIEDLAKELMNDAQTGKLKEKI